MYLLPLESIEAVDNFLRSREPQRQQLIGAALWYYDSAKAEAETRLGSLYDERNYPDKDQVRQAYGMSYSFIEFGTPGQLKAISADLYAREKEKAAEVFREAVEEGRKLLRDNFSQLVNHLVEKLTAADGERGRGFKLSKRLTQFLDFFDERNIITEDGELSVLVNQAQRLLDGADAKGLRKNRDLRTEVVQGFGAIKTELDKLIVEKPKRKIVFDAE